MVHCTLDASLCGERITDILLKSESSVNFHDSSKGSWSLHLGVGHHLSVETSRHTHLIVGIGQLDTMSSVVSNCSFVSGVIVE